MFVQQITLASQGMSPQKVERGVVMSLLFWAGKKLLATLDITAITDDMVDPADDGGNTTIVFFDINRIHPVPTKLLVRHAQRICDELGMEVNNAYMS